MKREERHQAVRQFIGFVWFNGDWWGSKEGVLVEALDLAEAEEMIREAFGPMVGISVWNEEDAARPR
jgi:hypothetical protein